MAFDPRLNAAVAAGRLTAVAIRRLGRGGGTTLPGRVGQRVDRHLLDKLSARLGGGTVLVSGTNGKTTTAGLVRHLLEAAGLPVVGNRAGANLDWGLSSALIGARRDVDLSRAVGVFEVDEGTLPLVAARLAPRLVVVTNLFRDQLDRYGELEASATAISAALASLPAGATALLCADDPAVAALGGGLRARVLHYGLEAPGLGEPGLPHAADARFCPRCGEPFEFGRVYVGHLGEYRCPRGDFERPALDFTARDVRFQGLDGQRLTLAAGPGQGDARKLVSTLDLDIPLSGLYNTYNVVAAAASALLLGVPPATVASAARGFQPAFGRLERIEAEGRTLRVLLAKNPAGFNEVLRASRLLGGGRHFLLSLNDRLADGRDVSWIWDVDFELLRDAERVVISGDRAADLAVRLEYAGLPAGRVTAGETQAAAIDAAIAATPVGGELCVLPTYTAMLDIRAELARRGLIRQFWEEA
ncbi:MAG TPA: MurT ligase domain-containing protein [Candidatus Dormibacteraeota bacterium]|jgi:UDP-N-acetylmuramyl tripeptide synthase|nr:MurT ligase domain-containing protein [Candidatus Dormibacteraeota bacterium]